MVADGCRILDARSRQIKIKQSFFIETEPHDSQINGFKILSEEGLKSQTKQKVFFSVAIADSQAREKIAERMKENGYESSTLIDRTAILHSNSSLGEGAILSHLAIVTANTNIGKYFVPNGTC